MHNDIHHFLAISTKNKPFIVHPPSVFNKKLNNFVIIFTFQTSFTSYNECQIKKMIICGCGYNEYSTVLLNKSKNF